MLRTLFFLGATLLVSACAAHSEVRCRTADARSIGYEDGYAGGKSDAEAYKSASDACKGHHSEINEAAYRAGWREGAAKRP